MRSFLIWLSLSVLVSVSASAQVPVRVVDGDSIRYGEMLIRIVGIDAPELRARCAAERILALQAKARMVDIAGQGVFIERVRRRDRYGRVLAIVRDSQGRDVAQLMIAAGLARPYGGGARQTWCEI